MSVFRNKIALLAYDVIALAKGYRFTAAKSEKDYEDTAIVYGEDGFSFPEYLKDDLQKYKAGALSFIARHRGMPVGIVRIADPKVINRPYELYGIDPTGAHYEIQSLTVRKGHRDGAQFAMLGMIKKVYEYSLSNGIKSWSACGTNSVYLTMRRFCKKTQVTDIDFKSINHPLTTYLYLNRIIETYFTMDVDAFEPWQIFIKCVKKMTKKWGAIEFIKSQLTQPYLLRTSLKYLPNLIGIVMLALLAC